MRRSAPSSSTWWMNSRRSWYGSFIRQVERAIDHLRGALEVVVAEHVHLHDKRRAAVELLVLLVAAAELGADEIPGEPHERDALARTDRRRLEVAFDVAAGFGTLEILYRRRQRDHPRTPEVAHDGGHLGVGGGLPRHHPGERGAARAQDARRHRRR